MLLMSLAGVPVRASRKLGAEGVAHVLFLQQVYDAKVLEERARGVDSGVLGEDQIFHRHVVKISKNNATHVRLGCLL